MWHDRTVKAVICGHCLWTATWWSQSLMQFFHLIFIVPLFCKSTCLLRAIFFENFSGRSKQVLLYIKNLYYLQMTVKFLLAVVLGTHLAQDVTKVSTNVGRFSQNRIFFQNLLEPYTDTIHFPLHLIRYPHLSQKCRILGLITLGCILVHKVSFTPSVMRQASRVKRHWRKIGFHWCLWCYSHLASSVKCLVSCINIMQDWLLDPF